MLFSLFKHNKSHILFIVPIVVTLLWVHVLNSNEFIDTNSNSPLFNLICHAIGNSRWLVFFISTTLMLLEIFLLNNLCNDYDLVQTKTYLPALLYILLMHSSPYFCILHPMMFFNLLLILAYYKLFRIYGNERNKNAIFDAGLLLSIAALFAPAYFIFFLFLLITILILRPFVWREWIIGLLGFLVPLLFLVAFYLMFSHLSELKLGNYFKFTFDTHIISNFKSITYALILILVSGLTFFSYLYITNNLNKWKVRTRKIYFILFWTILFGILGNLIIINWQFYYLTIFAIPLSITISSYLLSFKKEKMAELVLYILLALICIVHFFNTFEF